MKKLFTGFRRVIKIELRYDKEKDKYYFIDFDDNVNVELTKEEYLKLMLETNKLKALLGEIVGGKL